MKSFLFSKLVRKSSLLSKSLKDGDPEVFAILKKETNRQIQNINLIASENYPSNAVYEALGSTIQNLHDVEPLAIKRALALFNLGEEKWGASVTSQSGAPANFNAYNSVLNLGDKVMGLKLNCGGVI